MIRVPEGRRLIILDLDGTLAVMPIDWNGMKAALAEAFPGVSFAQISDGLRLVTRRYGTAGRTRCFQVIRTFEKPGVRHLTPVPEVVDVVRSRAGTASFAICSNNLSETVRDALRVLGLSGRFNALVGRDDVIEGKPAPEGLLRILGTLQIQPAEALFIGDRDSDADAGAKAGIETIILAR